jgi:hypothetical protein
MSRVLLLVFSTNANKSKQIKREVEIAADGGVTIVPLRIENILPTDSFKYFLGNIHWLDALTPPLEKHLQEVAAKVKAILNTESVSSSEASQPSLPGKTPTVYPPTRRNAVPVIGGIVAVLVATAVVLFFWQGRKTAPPSTAIIGTVASSSVSPVSPVVTTPAPTPEPAVVKLGRATFITDQLNSVQNLVRYLQEKGAQVVTLDTGHLGDLATTSPDIVVIGADTDGAWRNTSKTMLSKLFENYKVIGVGKGGAELFAQLGLQIGDPHGMHGQSGRVEIEIPKLLRSPFSVPGQDKVVEIYQPGQADVIGIYDEGSPVIAGFEGIARWVDARNHWPVCRQGNYLLWGFNAPAGEMTDAGRQLFVNLLVDHKVRRPVPLSQARAKVNYVKSGLIAERLTKQFPDQHWVFKLPQAGLISARLSWKPPEHPVALIVTSEQRHGFARKDGVSPLVIEYKATEEDVTRGEDWYVNVVSFGDLGSTVIDYELDLSLPDGSPMSAKSPRPAETTAPLLSSIFVSPSPEVPSAPSPADHSSTGQPLYPGELYPETRQRLLTKAEVASLNDAQLRYAINEMYARHGYTFPLEPPIKAQFRKFSWYHPDPNSGEQIEGSFSRIEKDNLELLVQVRDRRRH